LKDFLVKGTCRAGKALENEEDDSKHPGSGVFQISPQAILRKDGIRRTHKPPDVFLLQGNENEHPAKYQVGTA